MRDDIIVFTEDSCGGCDFIKKRLKDSNIRFIDINSEEAGRYLKEGQDVVVPSALSKGKRCLLKLKDDKIFAECEDGREFSLED